MATVGLRNMHVAIINDDGTYETPKKLAPAISAEVTPNFETTTLYGDDRAVEIEEALGSIDISIGITDLSTDDYAFLLGKTINEDGVVEDSTDDEAPYVAIGWELPKSKGSKRMYWYYKGKFTIPGNANTTKGESVEFQTPSITGKFMSREDGKWRARVDENDVDANSDVVRNWFNEVYESAAPTPTV